MIYPTNELMNAAKELEEPLRDIRRDLHRHPSIALRD